MTGDWKWYYIMLRHTDKEKVAEYPILRYGDSPEDAASHAYQDEKIQAWLPTVGIKIEVISIREATDWEVKHNHDCFKM